MTPQVDIEPVEEKTSIYYDDIYKGEYGLDHMVPVYDEVLKILLGMRAVVPRVLEIGCGTGILGKMIHEAGISYRGFDFSIVAIRKCPNEIRPFVVRRNAYHTAPYRVGHNTVVAVETMEHLDDLHILQRVKKGTHCVFTLPNFTDEAHLRVYNNPVDIRKYYKGVVKWSSIKTVIMDVDEGTKTGTKDIHVCKGIKL